MECLFVALLIWFVDWYLIALVVCHCFRYDVLLYYGRSFPLVDFSVGFGCYILCLWEARECHGEEISELVMHSVWKMVIRRNGGLSLLQGV